MAQLNEIQLPDGTRIKTAISPERFAELGLDLPPLPKPSLFATGATAENGAGGTGNVPATASDAGGAAGLSASEGTGHQPSDTTTQAAPSGTPVPSAEQQSFERDQAKLRGGGEVKNLNLDTSEPGGQQQFTQPRPQYRTIKAGDIKGADIRTGFSVQKSGASDILPEVEEQLSDARINQRLAAQEAGDVQKDTLEIERGRAVEEQIRREEQANRVAQRQAQFEAAQADYAQKQAQLDAEHDAITKSEVDPNRYWDNLGTGGKILAAIGMIAGGINAGMRGGPNQAIEFIYRAIRDDIAGQREKIEARRQGYNVRQTQLEKKMALLGGDIELAARELEANQLALAAAMMRADKAGAGIAAINPALLEFSAKLDAEAAASRLDNAGKFGSKVSEQFQFTPDRTIQVGGPVALKPEARERKITFNDGNSVGFVVSGNARDKVQTGITSMENIERSLAKLDALAAQATPGNLEAIRAYEAEQGILSAELNVGVGQGAISKDDAGRVEKSLPNVGDLTVSRDNARTRLQGTKQWARSRRDAWVRDNVYADPDANVRATPGLPGSYRPQ